MSKKENKHDVELVVSALQWQDKGVIFHVIDKVQYSFTYLMQTFKI